MRIVPGGSVANKQKVAILGGGVGAMTAAYQLTQFPDWQNRFEITIYQMGWRLGGKGASGRNAKVGQRIEEHGLHVWAGFYDNAIKLMKDCYKQGLDLSIDGLYASFDDAFKPFNNTVLGEFVDGKWIPWPVAPPGNPAVPGEGGLFLTPWDYFGMMVTLLKDMFEKHAAKAGILPTGGVDLLPDWLEPLLADALPSGSDTNTLLHVLHDIVHNPVTSFAAGHDGPHLDAISYVLKKLGQQLQQAYKQDLSGKDDLRRFIHVADLGMAALRGCIEDKVLFKGFDVINDYEISAWLKRHGAHPISLESASVRAVYDYAFGFAKGATNYQHRAIAAGVSLYGMCRLAFTYKKAFFFEMQAGMGDTVFTPFYKVLKAQGVQFKFFHKVTGIEADAQSKQITRITLQRQADLNQAEYQPLVNVKGLDCWPSEPHYGQLVQGSQLQTQGVDLESSWANWSGVEDIELKLGTDFDAVILGISVAALNEICSDLVDKDPRWEDMLREVKTTRTMAMQLWLKKTSKQLVWKYGESILTGYADPLNTWADLSHLILMEDWPSPAPKSVAYFCAPLDDDPNQQPYSDHGYPATQLALVEAESKQWIENHIGWMWPKLVKSDGSIDWDQLVSVNNVSGEALLKEQYFRANIDPTERYVLSEPGSIKYRIRADQSGFDNLFLAGDWTYNGINAGCVEAAAMSGMRAAAGLAGESLEIVGEAFSHAPYETPDEWEPTELTSLRAQNQAWPGSGLFGMAQTSGANALMTFPADVVQAMLPPGLELSPQTVTAPEQHPVVILFGWQEEVRPNLLPGGMNYREFIITVPYVRHSDPELQVKVPGPFIYMPRLYLDKAMPIWLGVYCYGYQKRRARIQTDDNSYEVSNADSNAPIIAGEYTKAGPTGSIMDYPHMHVANSLYSLPLISKNLLGWQYSYFDFALGQALIQPISMEIKIYNDEAAGLPAGLYQVPPIQGNGLGGFFFSTSSTITNPLQSWHLKKLIKEKHSAPNPQLLP